MCVMRSSGNAASYEIDLVVSRLGEKQWRVLEEGFQAGAEKGARKNLDELLISLGYIRSNKEKKKPGRKKKKSINYTVERKNRIVAFMTLVLGLSDEYYEPQDTLLAVFRTLTGFGSYAENGIFLTRKEASRVFSPHFQELPVKEWGPEHVVTRLRRTLERADSRGKWLREVFFNELAVEGFDAHSTGIDEILDELGELLGKGEHGLFGRIPGSRIKRLPQRSLVDRRESGTASRTQGMFESDLSASASVSLEECASTALAWLVLVKWLCKHTCLVEWKDLSRIYDLLSDPEIQGSGGQLDRVFAERRSILDRAALRQRWSPLRRNELETIDRDVDIPDVGEFLLEGWLV